MPRIDLVTPSGTSQLLWLPIWAAFVFTLAPQQVGATDAADPGSAQRDVAALDTEQRRLLRELKESLARIPDLPTPSADESTQVRQQRVRKAEILRLVAELERRIDARSLGGEVAPTKEASTQYRAYYDRLRIRIEQESAISMQGGALPPYGHLTLVLKIGSDGSVKSVDAEDSSSEEFREYTLRFVRRLAPFEPFPPAMAETADDVVITTTIEHARQ